MLGKQSLAGILQNPSTVFLYKVCDIGIQRESKILYQDNNVADFNLFNPVNRRNSKIVINFIKP
jgi:hypothetical protein